MTHPIVDQLRFARSELERGLDGLDPEDARRRIEPANSIAWNIGHLAWQEQRYWIVRLGGMKPISDRLNDEFCFGCPPSQPELDTMWAVWRQVVAAADPILDTLSTADLTEVRQAGERSYTIGNLLYRTIYHYWFHLGESMGLRQAMGHTDLAQFVGNIDDEAPFTSF